MQREDVKSNSANAVDSESLSSDSKPWGWLEPSSVLLPYVCLRGHGVTIGRGKEAFEERVSRNELPVGGGGGPLSNYRINGRVRDEALYEDLEFIEVADGRVSRIHCTIVQKMNASKLASFVEDCSSNGTFLNDTKIERGCQILLKDNDKISLVRSVAPMTEHYFIYHQGGPHPNDVSKFSSPGQSSEERARSARTLSRSLTSTYTTAERSTLADFVCQICLRTLSSCVAIEPCGHNFCASCLAQYLSNQVEQGAQLVCPLRCPNPERVVKNETVRSLIASKRRETAASSRLSANDEEFETIIEAEVYSFTSAFSLSDDQLPMEIKSLKDSQVELAVQRLSDGECDVSEKNERLEALVRLCWNDDSTRKIVLDMSGVATIKKLMETYQDNEGIQCNSCLVLMSLVRGEGEICRCCQWEIARSGIIEVIRKSMNRFESNQMVQLSAMLCFIPLALESPMMQAHLSEEVLPAVLTALDAHPDEADLQCKGMIVIGILAQGEDALQDAIRIRELDLGVIPRITRTLEKFGSENEEVFWGSLFALATLASDKCPRCPFICRALYQNGVLTLLTNTLRSYEARMSSRNEETDDSIRAAATYLITIISEARNTVHYEWKYLLYSGLSLSLLIGSIIALIALRRKPV
eukprot:g4438.t1